MKTADAGLPAQIKAFGDRVAELMAEHGIDAAMLFLLTDATVSYRVLAHEEGDGKVLHAVAELVLQDIETAQAVRRGREMGEVMGHG
jgi:hypothetical protein